MNKQTIARARFLQGCDWLKEVGLEACADLSLSAAARSLTQLAIGGAAITP